MTIHLTCFSFQYNIFSNSPLIVVCKIHIRIWLDPCWRQVSKLHSSSGPNHSNHTLTKASSAWVTTVLWQPDLDGFIISSAPRRYMAMRVNVGQHWPITQLLSRHVRCNCVSFWATLNPTKLLDIPLWVSAYEHCKSKPCLSQKVWRCFFLKTAQSRN